MCWTRLSPLSARQQSAPSATPTPRTWSRRTRRQEGASGERRWTSETFFGDEQRRGVFLWILLMRQQKKQGKKGRDIYLSIYLSMERANAWTGCSRKERSCFWICVETTTWYSRITTTTPLERSLSMRECLSLSFFGVGLSRCSETLPIWRRYRDLATFPCSRLSNFRLKSVLLPNFRFDCNFSLASPGQCEQTQSTFHWPKSSRKDRSFENKPSSSES